MDTWLVSRILSNSQASVAERLARLGIESCYPQYREQVIDQRTHRKRFAVVPLLPCYLFVRSIQFYFLFEVKGICGVIMFGDEPARSYQLDAQVEKWCRGHIEPPEKPEQFSIKIGDKVRIVRGALEHHEAECIMRHGARVQTVVDMFGQKVKAWHDSEADLELAA